jgi:DNA modification methylase
MAADVCEALWCALKPGGRVWCNIQATVPRDQPKRDGKNRQTTEERMNLAWIWENALRNAQFAYRDTIVWDQDRFDGGTAWGSYRKPSAPNLRGAHELILMYYKPPYKRETPPAFKGWEDPFGKEDWPELTRNIWKLGTARSKDHTAIFPVELPSRCIRLSTWPGETVLDPFCGSGTTGVAALQLGRRFVGFDVSPASLKVAEARLQSEEAQEKEAGSE